MKLVNHINNKYNLTETEVCFKIRFLGQIISFEGTEYNLES